MTYTTNKTNEAGGEERKSHGGYRNLISYQTTTLIYDLTVEFCRLYVSKFSRNVDQMTQAARSGRQNIAEGSQASATSKKTELKLVSVARSSLEELLSRVSHLVVIASDPPAAESVAISFGIASSPRSVDMNVTPRNDIGWVQLRNLWLLDFEDFLRQNSLKLWTKDSPKAQEVRALGYKTHRTYMTYKTYIQNPEDFANCLICLIHQANYLLDRQLQALEKDFITNGGYTENLFRKRSQFRTNTTNRTNKTNKR